MAYTTGTDSFLSNGSAQKVVSGSAKADWKIANSDITTTNTASLLRPGLATGETNIIALPIPEGATRILTRTRHPPSGVTFTTHPVVRYYVTDQNGVPTRIDNTDANATGITLTSSANTAADAAATYRYSNVSSLDGYDCLGGGTLFALIETAAAGASYTGAVMVLFLNS